MLLKWEQKELLSLIPECLPWINEISQLRPGQACVRYYMCVFLLLRGHHLFTARICS